MPTASGASTHGENVIAMNFLRQVLLVALVALAVAATDVDALSYSAKPIRATVVDAETGEPIEGVIVNAYWHLEDQDGHGLGPFNLTEAVTDAKGVFFMPGWGPLEVPRDSSQPSRRGRLDPDQPWLQVFKSGYKFTTVAGNESTAYLNDPLWSGDPVRTSVWDGKIIRLERFRETDERYLNHLEVVGPECVDDLPVRRLRAGPLGLPRQLVGRVR